MNSGQSRAQIANPSGVVGQSIVVDGLTRFDGLRAACKAVFAVESAVTVSFIDDEEA
jgi:hypothetical protein